jgi:hypothetical protein
MNLRNERGRKYKLRKMLATLSLPFLLQLVQPTSVLCDNLSVKISDTELQKFRLFSKP